MSIAQRIEELAFAQPWLDSFADRAQPALRQAFSAGGPTGQRLANLLHGTWLGHPLHAAIVSVPIGSWTLAVMMDLAETLGATRAARAADAAVGFGIIGAVAAAAAGLTDWKEIDGRARRAGLAHGLLNTAALILFVKSWLLRCNGNREAGRVAGGVGYGIAGAAAVLGGDLVYGLRIGVNHAADEELPSDFVAVLPAADLPENTPRRVLAAGVPVLLLRRGDHIFAIGEKCSHLGGPLADGPIEDGSVICPWHGSRFALSNGSVLDGPATFPEPCFDSRVRDGQIEVRSGAR